MNESTRRPWAQSPTGQMVVNGTISGGVGAIIAWLLNNATNLPWLAIGAVFVGGTALAFLVLTLVRRNLRELLWIRPFKWLIGLRITTMRSRNLIEAAGYDRRSTELATERKGARQPRWRISAQDRLSGLVNVHWLENSGYEAFDVALTCDPELFTLDGEVFFRGGFGTNSPGGSIGKQFLGAPTERGRTEGVTFRISWRDENQNQWDKDVFMPPEEIRLGHDDAVEEARAVGWKEGYAEAKSVFEQAEVSASQSEKPVLPRPKPRWKLTHVDGEGSGARTYRLANLMSKSIAYNVRIDLVEGKFNFLDEAFWEDLSGNGVGTFRGAMPDTYLGATLSLSWLDENQGVHTQRFKLQTDLPF